MAYKKIRSPKERARRRRKHSIRKRISGTAERPRLSVFRSNKYIYAQAIDDVANRVIAAVSDLEKTIQGDSDGKDKRIA